eukprot:scaffold1253_cov245-Pinguiococcus_pyrenoidosus.AAC.20
MPLVASSSRQGCQISRDGRRNMGLVHRERSAEEQGGDTAAEAAVRRGGRGRGVQHKSSGIRGGLLGSAWCPCEQTRVDLRKRAGGPVEDRMKFTIVP